ncbi:pyridoxamine 5'-phosphate oxidase family protein [Mucilaginibacter daejeonensis]|uniref:pyridoxamine 5'-phosphate oxidase family protein n=1 Tax=Mucilaginibacter daejeonensis TaxID=398049 RepID=UPI001D173216|nr:pyridoxamine 5'-phosphate oxidase family protein [Mucilaginibacter daejeonensis]UEG51523.1 pyridoxamine 5'-phosphate oxidase family protein [Mucilaginibacter daejeonensis]
MNFEKDLKKLQDTDHLRGLIDKANTAMLTTFTLDGGFHSRPMATAQLDVDGNLWFFTNEFSSKVAEISHENKVNITYSNSTNNTFISVNGSAAIVDDRTRMKELWSPAVEVFFKDGIDDPALTLLKVNITDAEYWDNSAGTIGLAFKWLKSVITGDKFEPGEHEKVEL